GDADDERQLGLGRFHDGVRGEWRRHEDERRVRACLVYAFGHRVEDGPAFVRRSTLAGRDSADNLRAILLARLGVERSFAAGQALDDYFGVLIDKNAHEFFPAAAATTFSAASFIVSATW